MENIWRIKSETKYGFQDLKERRRSTWNQG